MIKKTGFTLVELIVSISLVLLLFTLIVPGITKIIQQSRIKQCEQIKETILTAVDLYVTENKNSIRPAATIILSSLYEGDYIEEEYIIELNNSRITKGKWIKKDSTEQDIEVYRNPTPGNEYYTYTIAPESDFCK